ncbi:MAG: alpha/beta fold hydrolase [Rhodobacteraceae bacterium]|nr:alpha/beta fold hydrolase [Paracoccaceae bacterium]
MQVRGRIGADPAVLWALLRDFAAPWHPAVAEMREERGPGGAVRRRFSVRGEAGTYLEQLSYLSDSDHVLAYRALEGIADVESYAARISLDETADGGTALLWSAEIRAPEARLAAICAGTEAVFEAGIAWLSGNAARLPQRPVPDLPPPSGGVLEERLLEGTPRLALTCAAGGAGPLVLFLHGIGGNRTNWEAQLRAVAPLAPAAALDLRGYGGSSLGFGPSDVDGYCEDILRVAEALGAERLVLVGLSYGAWIATSFAMRHPERLAGLVLSGGCTGMSEAGPEEREAFRISREVPLDAGQRPADFAPAVVDVIAGPGAGRATRAHLLEAMAAIPAETYRDALRCFTNPLERFDFGRLSMPCLLMTGAHDRLAPPAEIRAVAGRILDAAPLADVRFEVLEGAGHVCNVEAPAAYDANLARFVARVAR